MSQYLKVNDAIKRLAQMDEFCEFMSQVTERRRMWDIENRQLEGRNTVTGVQVMADLEQLAREAGYKPRKGAEHEME